MEVMPYIDHNSKVALANRDAQTPGELNYVFTLVALKYFKSRGKSYQTINDILGAFDGASKEFYRRVAVPYEDDKIAANGDVY
jgi:hypothetical protein